MAPDDFRNALNLSGGLHIWAAPGWLGGSGGIKGTEWGERVKGMERVGRSLGGRRGGGVRGEMGSD